eukprot:12642981-Ditylum_brightwellii.AAC.1
MSAMTMDDSKIINTTSSKELYAQDATSLTEINKVGGKMRTLLIKPQTAHCKVNFDIFNKTYERMELETFPKKTEDVIRSSKDTVVKRGYLTGVNQDTVHCLGYQDEINDLMDSVLDNIKEGHQIEYLKEYGTNAKDAVYD